MSEWDFNNTHINECALKSKVNDLFLHIVVVFCRSYLLNSRLLRLNPSGLRTKYKSVSHTSDGQQRTDESCPKIPATDAPR